MGNVNMRLLKLELDRQLDKNADAIFQKIKPKIQKKFNEAKARMLDDFDEHPVTQEIAAGPEESGKLVKTAAGGNLFSLLGFFNSDQPIEELRKILIQNVTLQIQYTRKIKTERGIRWETPVYTPTLEEIGKLTSARNRLAWTSRGWTYLIENGIPWFSHYLFDNERTIKGSRSGTAIEIKGTIKAGRDSSFAGIPYLSEIIRDFQKRIGNKT